MTFDKLSINGWEHVYADAETYSEFCNYYYQAHVDAMIEGMEKEQKNIPAFLNGICHFRYTVHRRALLPLRNYHFLVCYFHLFRFPLNITLLAIEIDDSGNSLDALTWGHGQLMGWRDNYTNYPVWTKTVFEPLRNLLKTNDIMQLCGDGNKLKTYQIINVPSRAIDDRDALLYEIGTSSPIGCVNKNMWISPAPEYYNLIMKQNSVVVFKDWKALALNDSFTMLDGGEKPPIRKSWDDNYKLWLLHYFQLIYLRCFFEKTFCLSRNIAYRQGQAVENLSSNIADMERYYFYDNISYNFLPNMLYKAMAKGLGIKEEREEISKQIKERAKEDMESKMQEEADRKGRVENNRNLIGFVLGIFAIFSVAWDLCSMLNAATNNCIQQVFAIGFFAVAILAIIAFVIYYKYKNNETKQTCNFTRSA